MARRRKHAVRTGHGVMCNICGKSCGKGGALKAHIEGRHSPVSYEAYKTCFYDADRVLADAWDDSVKTSKGKTVVVHVLARRFVQHPSGKTSHALSAQAIRIKPPFLYHRRTTGAEPPHRSPNRPAGSESFGIGKCGTSWNRSLPSLRTSSPARSLRMSMTT